MTHQFGSVRIDLRGTAVFRKGDFVPVSAREFQLLRYLLQHRGATIPRGRFYERYGATVQTPTLAPLTFISSAFVTKSKMIRRSQA